MSSLSNFIDNIRSKISSNNRESVNQESHGVEVYVNVYDMTGVYHTGVEVHHIEYCFGGHPHDCSGIFRMVPKNAEHLGENYSLKTSIKVGFTDFTENDVNDIVESLGNNFKGKQYHLLDKNCNHFTQTFIEYLCGATLPPWVNRLANITSNMSIIKNNIPPQLLTPQNYMTDSNEIIPFDEEAFVVERPFISDQNASLSLASFDFYPPDDFNNTGSSARIEENVSISHNAQNIVLIQENSDGRSDLKEKGPTNSNLFENI